MTVSTSWIELKTFADSKGAMIQYIQTSDAYHICCISGGIEVTTMIVKTSPPTLEQQSFEEYISQT